MSIKYNKQIATINNNYCIVEYWFSKQEIEKDDLYDKLNCVRLFIHKLLEKNIYNGKAYFIYSKNKIGLKCYVPSCMVMENFAKRLHYKLDTYLDKNFFDKIEDEIYAFSHSVHNKGEI